MARWLIAIYVIAVLLLAGFTKAKSHEKETLNPSKDEFTFDKTPKYP